MASASSGFESFVGGSVYDPAAGARNTDTKQVAIVAGVAAVFLLLLFVLKK